MHNRIRSLSRLSLVVGLAGMLATEPGRADVRNLTHPYTNTTIASVIANAATVDGDVILVNTNVQTENSIALSKGVTIKGLGMTNTILQAATSRGGVNQYIFYAGTVGKIWAIQDMTLRYGSNSSSTYAGVLTLGAATTGTVLRCHVTQNDQSHAYGGDGAIGLTANGSSLIVTNCMFSSNRCDGAGAIGVTLAGASLVVRDSAFFDNNAFNGSSGGNGGAINRSAGSLSTFLVANSTFTRNTAAGYGGAMSINANVAGGATNNYIYNCTIFSNTALTGSSSLYSGGIFYYGQNNGSDGLLVDSCILSSNYNAEINSHYGTVYVTNSLITGSAVNGGQKLATNGCVIGVSPMLAPLANNAGPTPTLALLSGSPCINKGDNSLGLAFDQRGAGYARQIGSAVDIGAFEYGAGPTNLTYSKIAFTATAPGSGNIDNSTPLLLTLDLDTFSGSDGAWSTNNMLAVTNLPIGLVVSMVRTNGGTNMQVQLTGTATSHAAANSLSNLVFVFQNAAFSGNNAATINGSATTNLSITFYDSSAGGSLAYSSTNFYEDAVWNDGRIATTNTIILTGDQFAGADNSVMGPDKVVATGVPGGLTAVVTRVNGTTASVALTGRATANAAANSTNWVLAFQNAAFFQGGNAQAITNSTMTNSVIFLDPATNVQLLFGGTVFNEAAANNGSIANTLAITLTNDVFVGANGENFVATGKVVPAHVPPGLTAVVTYVDLTHVNATLTGNALSNNVSDNVYNLNLAFQNTAFYNTAAAAVTNSSRSDLSVQFLDPALTYAGTGFIESWRNDGTIDNSTPVMVTLAGDTFAGAIGQNLVGAGVTVANVPNGLTAVATKTAAQTVAITLTGTATASDQANSTNITVSFGDAAFTRGPASVATNSGPDNLTVTFMNAASNVYVATAANGGSDNNLGTLASPFATIRKALTVVRQNNNDVINVGPGTFTESNIVVSTPVVTIQGAGKNTTIVQGAATVLSGINKPIFSLIGTRAAIIANLTIQNGDQTYGSHGAAIDSSVPILYLTNCNLTGNNTYGTAGYQNGSALYLEEGGPSGAHAYVLNCDVVGNTAIGANAGSAGFYVGEPTTISNCNFTGNISSNGGAVYIDAGLSLAVYDSSFSGNVGAAFGGAVYSANATNLWFERCSFVNNATTGAGGALDVEASGPALACLINCTLANNTAGTLGGGFYGHYAPMLARMYNCTLVGNMAGTGGGGAWMQYCTNWVVDSTIMASNSAPAGPDFSENASSGNVANNCLIGNNSGCSTLFPAGLPNAGGSYVGSTGTALINPQLGPPANNGGATLTCALQKGSPAIDRGSNPLGLTTDQRGGKHTRQYGAGADIGAYEYVPALGTALIVW